MGDYNKRGNDRGGFRGNRGGGFGSRGDFHKKSWGGRDDRQKEMYSATCANCGKPCEVPFRPTNGKPVYCRDCFGKVEGREGTPRKEFSGGRDREQAPRFENNRGNDEVQKQLANLNTKLDRLIQAVEGLAKVPAPVSETPKKAAKGFLAKAAEKKTAKNAKKVTAKKTKK
jgi:CxxC-x17-CxxC domain-containing protein